MTILFLSDIFVSERDKYITYERGAFYDSEKFLFRIPWVFGIFCRSLFYDRGYYQSCLPGFFFLGKIQGDQADERYQEDRKTALAFIGHLALFLLAAIWIIGLFMSNLEVTFILVVIAYVVLILAYAVKLYWLEER